MPAAIPLFVQPFSSQEGYFERYRGQLVTYRALLFWQHFAKSCLNHFPRILLFTYVNNVRASLVPSAALPNNPSAHGLLIGNRLPALQVS